MFFFLPPGVNFSGGGGGGGGGGPWLLVTTTVADVLLTVKECCRECNMYRKGKDIRKKETSNFKASYLLASDTTGRRTLQMETVPVREDCKEFKIYCTGKKKTLNKILSFVW